MRRATTALGVVLALVAGWLAVREADPGEVARALADADYAWLAAALGAVVIVGVMRVARWQALFDPRSRPPFRPLAVALVIGQFFNIVLPARAGEAARVVALHRMTDASRAETAGTVVLERAFDVLALLLLLLVSVPVLPEVGWLRAAVLLTILLTGTLAVAIVVLAYWSDRPFRWLLAPLTRLERVPAERVEKIAASAAAGLAGLRQVRVAALAGAWTVTSWLALGASAWFVALAFELGVSPAAGLLVVIAVNLAMVLPSSPAAIGVFEGATLVALAPYGVSASPALSYAIVFHALNVLPFLAIGGVLLIGASAAPAWRRTRAPR